MSADLGGGETGHTAALTTTDDVAIDETLIVNGSINVRKTHPALYRMVMATGVISIALGVNFLVFTPSFLVYDQRNELWAAIFLTLGLGKIVFLNVYRSLKLTRVTMAAAAFYYLGFGAGTMQPALEGKGSLQLPILYGGLVALLVFLLVEPFINPWTAKRDE